ncbi:IclR family transcriptional regulator [Halomarina halobia]|uniref:IclR family transcriptional regulator n=1 Tax=Halomarina halobia TaxID=3033386 RepID=A0ABD6AFX2_9EURY|nr:IclR family transcriptional regulator [Halomarina sp. PSR21]
MESKRKRIKAVVRAMEIMEILQERDSTTADEAAAELGVSKSTAYYHLQTLTDAGYVIDNDGVYRLALRFFSLGTDVRHKQPIYHTAREQVSRLADETGELALLMVEEGGKGIYLDLKRGDRAVIRADWLGNQCHLHDNALGKSILAFLTQRRVNEIFERHGLPATTENTVTDANVLHKELEEIRESGVAFDHEEQLEGLQCVAAPIVGSEGGRQSVYGAICIASPTSRMTEERLTETFPELVRDAANIIQLNYIPE